MSIMYTMGKETNYEIQSTVSFATWSALHALAIKAWDGTVKYLDPQKYQIEMRGCTLINKKNAAEKVHAAGKKDVCGWVECHNFDILEKGKDTY